MTDLSVVIPTLNEEYRLGAVLHHARQHSGLDAIQLIVVDGGSTDESVRVAEDFAADILRSPAGRGRQLNLGLSRAKGGAVLFCHGDTRLPPGYGQAILRALEDPAVAGGAFRPRYNSSSPLLIALELMLRIPTPFLMFGDQALFARRSALADVGGVPELPLMEDVELMMRLRRQGRLVRLPLAVQTSPRRLQARGILRQLLLDARLLVSYHLFGEEPRRLAPRYQVTARDQPLAHSAQGRALVVFTKAPIPGHAKTRLGRELGMQRAAEIYEQLLGEQLANLGVGHVKADRWVYAAGEQDRRWFAEQLRGWSLAVQQPGDLGDRLAGAFRGLFARGADRVVIVGADSPDLTTDHIERAFVALDDSDLVLGPAADGGYYLIGQRPPGAPLFDGIPWGGPSVLRRTLARAGALGLEVELLPTLADIDTASEWRAYRARAEAE